MTKRRSAHRSFVSYIDKSRDFYAAQGYTRPYQWARFDDVPFTPLAKPLDQCRIGIVTTAFLHSEDAPPDPSKAVYNHPVAGRPRRMYTDDLSWDKDATHTNDTESFLPLDRLGELAADGVIGSVGPRFYGVPTEYSQRATLASAETIEQWCREDELDAVLLVPL